MTLNELIYDVWDLISPNISDDSPFTQRHFAFWIHNQRALMARNEINKNRTVDNALIQDLGCLELEVADRADCCEIKDGCTILRTKLELPKPIDLHHKVAITRVADIDKTDKPYSFVNYDRAVNSGYGRYTKNEIYAFWLNNRIYIKSNNPLNNYLTHINVRGVFENPEDAGKLNTCDGACYTQDDDYPLPRYMWMFMKEMIIKGNIGVALNSVGDSENNAKSDNSQVAAEVKQTNG